MAKENNYAFIDRFFIFIYNKNINGIMRKINLKNIVWKEGKHYVAWNLNTGVSSFGSSRKESLDALYEALELYFEDSLITSIQKVERPDIVPMTFSYA